MGSQFKYMDAHNIDVKGEKTKIRRSHSQNLTHYKTQQVK